MSSKSTLNYLSIERNLGPDSVGKSTDASYSFFERSSLSYVLPVIPLSRGTEIGAHRLGLSSGNATQKNPSYVGFFETGSKRPKVSNFKHWWRDTPESTVHQNTKLDVFRISDKNKSFANIDTQYQYITWPQSTIKGTQQRVKEQSSSAYTGYRQASVKGNRNEGHNKEITSLTHSLKVQEQVYSLIKTQIHSWNWLTWNFERHQVITGRICRPLQRAGFCVLLGGFPVFLPYAQFRQLQSFTHKQEGSLQSFQISTLSGVATTGDVLRKFPIYNCVVSRDQFIRRIGQHVISRPL